MTELKVMDKVDINGREFTRILGGFREDGFVISDKQIGELLGYNIGARQVRRHVENNISSFEFGLHILDLKDVSDSDPVLYKLGYSNMEIIKAEHIYIFSQQGFNLLLQIADIRVNYDDFELEYFGRIGLKYSKIRHEHSFEELLNGVLFSICKFKRQYTPVGTKYRIDFYEPNFNIAVEYDEEHHKHSKQSDINRQKEIENILNCKFVRIEKGNEVNGINNIIKEVLNLKGGN